MKLQIKPKPLISL